MDLLTAIKILVRQWPVVVTGLVLTVVAVIQVGGMVAPQYEAKGTVLLLSPGANANPYLDFGPNLEVAADALMVVVQSPVGATNLEAAGAAGTFKLERVSGPLIDISATAASKDEASRTVDLVVTALEGELTTAQEAAAPEQRITLTELTEPVPQQKLGSRIRAQAAVGALGLALTVSAGLTVDALRRQRRERRAARAERAERDWNDPDAPGPGEPEQPVAAPRVAGVWGNGGGPNGAVRPDDVRPNAARRRAQAAATAARTAAPIPAPSRRSSSSSNGRPPVARPGGTSWGDRSRAYPSGPGQTGSDGAADRPAPGTTRGDETRAARR